MRRTLRRRLMAAGLVLALTATPGNSQTSPTAPREERTIFLPPASTQDQGTAVKPAVMLPRATSAAAPACPSSCLPGRPSLWQRWKYNLQDRCLGYPSEFQAPPLGYWVNLHVTTQITNGIAARMMLYDYDFECGAAKLNLRGKDRLVRMADWLATQPFPLIVERTPRQPKLAESRRVALLNELAAAGFTIPPERVLVGPAPLGQLTGVEAEILYQRLLGYTQHGWPVAPTGGGSLGPSSGSSGSGGSGSADGSPRQ